MNPNRHANPSIACTVSTCAFHCKDQNHCSLNEIKVGCTAARSALIVATPDPISARDGGVVCDLLAEAGITRRRLIINRVDAKAVARGPISDLDEIIDTVGARLLGVLPESTALHLAAVSGRALPEGEAATAFANIARRLEGEQVPLAVQ